MPKVFVQRDLVRRIAQFGLDKELKSFVDACRNGEHPPRIYKPSGLLPTFTPYRNLDLYHHHLHRDGDPLLITQHVEGAIYGIGLSNHAMYFQGDKMLWLKGHIDVIDWTGWEALKRSVESYDPESSD